MRVLKRYTTYQKVLVCVLPFAVLFLLALTALFLTAHITFPECGFHRIFGLYCPGCGNTRAVIALLKGDILLSLRENISIVLALISVILLYSEVIFKVFGKNLRSPIRNYYFLYGILIFLAFYFVARNFIPQIAPI